MLVVVRAARILATGEPLQTVCTPISKLDLGVNPKLTFVNVLCFAHKQGGWLSIQVLVCALGDRSSGQFNIRSTALAVRKAHSVSALAGECD